MYSWRVAGSCSHGPTLKRVAFWRLTLDGANDPQKGLSASPYSKYLSSRFGFVLRCQDRRPSHSPLPSSAKSILRNDVGLVFRGLLGLGRQDFFEDMLANEGRTFLPQHRGLERIWPAEDFPDFQSEIHIKPFVPRIKSALRLILTQGLILPLTVRRHPRDQLAERWVTFVMNQCQLQSGRTNLL